MLPKTSNDTVKFKGAVSSTIAMPINRSYGKIPDGDFRETPKPLDFEGYDFGMANR